MLTTTIEEARYFADRLLRQAQREAQKEIRLGNSPTYWVATINTIDLLDLVDPIETMGVLNELRFLRYRRAERWKEQVRAGHYSEFKEVHA